MSHRGGSTDSSQEFGSTYTTSFGADERPSETVVSAVASLTGTDAIALSPLYDAIEPDALDALFTYARRLDVPATHRLAFTYEGYDVLVRGDGTVELTEMTPVRPTRTDPE